MDILDLFCINIQEKSKESLDDAKHFVNVYIPTEMKHAFILVAGRCSILPAILDLLMNLSLPNETAPGFLMSGGPVMMGGGQPPLM